MRVRALVLAAAATLALAACGTLRSPAPREAYEATLSGAQEVPAVGSSGTGTARVRYDPPTSMLRWEVDYAGLTGPLTGAHIHGPAGPGQNAGVVIPFAPRPSPLAGELRITPEQAAQLESGQWYVNLHTAQHPAGEIRGQLRPRR